MPPGETKTAGAETVDGRLRSDARENRQRILAAARETFATHGLDVPMIELARRAGVGAATMYRRFPTKEALVTEAFREQMAECLAVVEAALVDEDPWRGLCAVLEKVCAMQATDQGFTEAVIARFPDAVWIDEDGAKAERGLAELARRAKTTGQLRADFEVDDLKLLIMANAGLVSDDPSISADASRRLVAYLLQSFRAHPQDPPEPLPPAPALTFKNAVGRAHQHAAAIPVDGGHPVTT